MGYGVWLFVGLVFGVPGSWAGITSPPGPALSGPVGRLEQLRHPVRAIAVLAGGGIFVLGYVIYGLMAIFLVIIRTRWTTATSRIISLRASRLADPLLGRAKATDPVRLARFLAYPESVAAPMTANAHSRQLGLIPYRGAGHQARGTVVPAWPSKIPPASAPSGDVPRQARLVPSWQNQPSIRPGPGKTKYVHSPRTRDAQCAHTRPRAPG